MIAWLKLLRLPNVFTAAADVMMGYLVTRGRLEPPEHVTLLVAASCLLYLSGMVLNDVFDADVDARERPARPIPSGAVSLRAARNAGWSLLAGGTLAAGLLSYLARNTSPIIIATPLAGCILLYDGMLKRTAFAPLMMGACRMLNVLLGMSLVYLRKGELLMPRSWLPHEWMIAAGIGMYIVGVTIFARTEARDSARGRLAIGLIVLLAGMALLAATPSLTTYRRLVVSPNGWYLLWVVLALITARRCVLAILRPTPQQVQAAVRHAVHSIIVVDAAVCAGYAGPFWGLVVLSLLFPTLLLTMWLDAT